MSQREPFGSQVVRAFADRPEVSGRGVVCHRRSVSEEEPRQRAVQPTIGGSVYVKPQEIVIAQAFACGSTVRVSSRVPGACG